MKMKVIVIGLLVLLGFRTSSVGKDTNGGVAGVKAGLLGIGFFSDTNNGEKVEIGKMNGYTIYKDNNTFAVVRTPDKTGYNSSQQNALTQHPLAHVLERHGHDVTDLALIKRARDGFAPDGSYIGNISNPFKPFSSKFNDPSKLILAYNKTNPTSLAWTSRVQNNYGGWDVFYEDVNIIFGKGIAPPGSGVFENLTKVKASYEKVSPGVFQLITMFPIK
jgi:hypothetical protein